MGSPSASAFATRGGSASGGRRLTARLTRSRTSLAARSRSAPSSNSMRMLLEPSEEDEVSVLIPSIPLICSSSGSVIWASITSAFAPR